MYLFIYLIIYLFIYLFVYLSIYLFIYMVAIITNMDNMECIQHHTIVYGLIWSTIPWTWQTWSSGSFSGIGGY